MFDFWNLPSQANHILTGMQNGTTAKQDTDSSTQAAIYQTPDAGLPIIRELRVLRRKIKRVEGKVAYILSPIDLRKALVESRTTIRPRNVGHSDIAREAMQ